MLGGSLMAILFSSAGPVYYERLTGDAVYVPLTDMLAALHAETHLLAVETIEILWQGHLGNPDFPELGISAFPSLHLGIATTIACFAFTFGRAWGIAGTLFTAAILFGSVHLGWHYLVDGIGRYRHGRVLLVDRLALRRLVAGR